MLSRFGRPGGSRVIAAVVDANYADYCSNLRLMKTLEAIRSLKRCRGDLITITRTTADFGIVDIWLGHGEAFPFAV